MCTFFVRLCFVVHATMRECLSPQHPFFSQPAGGGRRRTISGAHTHTSTYMCIRQHAHTRVTPRNQIAEKRKEARRNGGGGGGGGRAGEFVGGDSAQNEGFSHEGHREAMRKGGGGGGGQRRAGQGRNRETPYTIQVNHIMCTDTPIHTHIHTYIQARLHAPLPPRPTHTYGDSEGRGRCTDDQMEVRTHTRSLMEGGKGRGQERVCVGVCVCVCTA